MKKPYNYYLFFIALVSLSFKWILALIVIVVALGFKFYARGILSSASVLIGLIAGYVVAIFMGVVNFDAVANASWFALPVPFKYGFEIQAAAIIGMCLMAVVSAIETVGDISGITKGGAGREGERPAIPGAGSARARAAAPGS